MLRGQDLPPGLAGEIVRFGAFLRGRNFKVFQTSLHAALEACTCIALHSRDDFQAALRTTLTVGAMEWAAFPRLFELFWKGRGMGPPASPSPSPRTADPPAEDLPLMQEERVSGKTVRREEASPREYLEGVAYSPVSCVEKKDFGKLEAADIHVATLALQEIARPFALEFSRRTRAGRRAGQLDFPRTLRKGLRTEGVPLELEFLARRRRLKRLVVLADVSGSMDRYARFVLPFLLGLRGMGSRTEVFAFSTQLTPLTRVIRRLPPEKALARMAEDVPHWSGGTRIGHCLKEFLATHGNRITPRRTVAVIFSDGWDLGGRELLGRQMARLRQRVHTILWLNPMAGDPDYLPLLQGMQTALPYVDHLLAADSLQSLKRVGHVLGKVMLH